MIILQISPEFSARTGVGAVAFFLEQEWLARGHDVRRFGISDAGTARFSQPSPGFVGRVRHGLAVIGFSTIGSARARKATARLPAGAVSICHNDALAGDVYVNHGILQTSMRARGNYHWRMSRNPLHLFTAMRDRYRYGSSTHRVVVNLTQEEDKALRRIHPRLRPQTRVIGNGVDTNEFRPPTDGERDRARAELGLPSDAVVCVFVGNEFDRKGLWPLIEAMGKLTQRHHLVVVGGTADMTAHAAKRVSRQGLDHRIHLVGPQQPQSYLWAADVLAQPSTYESYGLVVTEALASGVPVLSTRVGCAAELIQQGVNGYLTDGTAKDIAQWLTALEQADRESLRVEARRSAMDHTWGRVAEKYLELFAVLSEQRGE